MMPYDTLPARYRDMIPAKNGQDIFRSTINSQLADGKSEEVAFASAWAALQRAGYERNSSGKWVEKTQPGASAVHVPGTEWETEKASPRVGSRVSWSSSGGTARGVIRSIHRSGKVPNIPVTINASEDEPAARIELLDDEGQPRGEFVGHKLDTLGVSKVQKAEYQGRQVTLNRPSRLPKGSSKKFEVYVKDGDKVKRVTFGDPNMEIRRDDAEARANFRARHSCDTATDKTSARYWSCRMWSAGTTVRDLAKRILNDDTFTTREEAMARSYDLGLEGEIHVHQTADGQATYMPGESHEAYLDTMATRAGLYDAEDMDDGYDAEDMNEEESENESGGLLERVISAIVQAVTKGDDMDETFVKTADVIKVDGERRIAWGWASVSTLKGEMVVDRQGDIITPVEMEKMADRFMLSARTAKAMHEGAGVGEVIHSLPLTKELSAALGIETDREGWVIGMKIHDDKTWQAFRENRLRAFSIGGKAKRQEIKE